MNHNAVFIDTHFERRFLQAGRPLKVLMARVFAIYPASKDGGSLAVKVDKV